MIRLFLQNQLAQLDLDLDGDNILHLWTRFRSLLALSLRYVTKARLKYRYFAISSLRSATNIMKCTFGTYPGWSNVVYMPTSFQNLQPEVEDIIATESPCSQ